MVSKFVAMGFTSFWVDSEQDAAYQGNRTIAEFIRTQDYVIIWVWSGNEITL